MQPWWLVAVSLRPLCSPTHSYVGLKGLVTVTPRRPGTRSPSAIWPTILPGSPRCQDFRALSVHCSLLCARFSRPGAHRFARSVPPRRPPFGHFKRTYVCRSCFPSWWGAPWSAAPCPRRIGQKVEPTVLAGPLLYHTSHSGLVGVEVVSTHCPRRTEPAPYVGIHGSAHFV